MSETAGKPKTPDLYEKAFLNALHRSTLRAQQGGGIVFPYGFPCIGYRLDDWQFDRYCAGLEDAILGAAGRKRAKAAFWIINLCLIGVFVLAVAVNFIQDAGVLVLENDTWLRMAAILVPVTCAIAGYIMLNNQALAFARPFRKAPRVGRFAYLRARWLGALAAQGKGVVTLHLFALVPLTFAAYLIWLALTPSNYPLVLSLFFVPLLAYATWRFVLLFLYWSFHRRYGRMPTTEDLEPV